MDMFSSNLKAIRTDKGLTQVKLAELIGMTQTTVAGWETRNKKPKSQETIDTLCDALGVTEKDLFGFDDGYFARSSGMSGRIADPGNIFQSSAPLLGHIAAGDPNAAIEFADETHDLPKRVRDRFPDGFFLRVQGDSMNKVLPDGCYAYVAPVDESEIHENDVVAVKVNGDEATVKRIKMFDGVIILIPDSTNPEHKRRFIDKYNPDAPYVRILGKVVWYDFEFVRF